MAYGTSDLDAKLKFNFERLRNKSRTASLIKYQIAMKALRQIKADPSGCPMCDSGKLRDPDKAHWDTCGYLLMEMVLTCAD